LKYAETGELLKIFKAFAIGIQQNDVIAFDILRNRVSSSCHFSLIQNIVKKLVQ
jgi:hypothetical protein